MDSRLLEEAVKAYCEKLGLEYISVADALKTVAKVEKGLSLLSKYTTICETIKHTGNVNEDAVKSSVGYSREDFGFMEVDRDYDCKIVLLGNQASNYPHATESVTSSVNARIGTIYSYSYGTSQLTSEYVSSMTSHSKDMMNYIWSENGEYRAVKVWVDTGRYSGGYFEKAVYHKDSKQYQAYGNWYYATLVPMYADAQAHADKLEFLAGIAGAANQSYNPYTGPVNHATNPQGPSTGNETYKDTNSSIGNTGQGSVGNSTSPSGHVISGNSTTNGYTEPGNTNPGYVPPSVSNGIGTGTVQGSGNLFDLKNPKSFENANIKSVEAFLDNNLKNWTKAPLRDGNGIRFYDGKGNSYQLNYGYSNASDTVHGGPYLKISGGPEIIHIKLTK